VYGFTLEVIVRSVRAGLATAQAKPILAGGRTMEVSPVRITEAGWRARALIYVNARAVQGHIHQRQGRRLMEWPFTWRQGPAVRVCPSRGLQGRPILA
jgi:hypothetical protein